MKSRAQRCATPVGDGARRRNVALVVSALTVSALATGMFLGGAAQADTPGDPAGAQIRITEVAYGGKIADPVGDGEYVELTNVGTAPQSFAGWTYTGKPGSGTLPLDGFGTVGPGESVLITDVDPAAFRADWGLAASVQVIDDKADGFSVTLDKGPDTPTIYDSTAAVVDSVSYQAGFFPGKGSSAWPDAAHLGAKADTTGWTLSTVGDAEGSWTSASGGVGSPGTYVSAAAGGPTGGGGGTPPTGTVSDPWRDASSAGITAQAWPGPQAVTTADNTDVGQNMSGLFYVAGATPAEDYMWGVENGDSGAPLHTGQSSLFKLVRDANGNWGPAAGWEEGIKLHYSDGTGQPDSEGVTAVGGKVFISTERDNTNSKVSRVSILEFDPSTIADGAMNAVAQWELEPDLGPGTDANLTSPADANLGAEAVTFVPDSYLVANGFRTDAGARYNPRRYGEHQGGVFFAGIEKNGTMYGYVLQRGGRITRVATFSSGFNRVMDAMWDPSQDAMWLDCDNGCQGQSSIAKLNTTAGDPNRGHFQTVTIYDRPTGGPNVNNEGFTAAPLSECDPVTNLRAVWWADDGDDSGHALRTARATCATPITGQVGATVRAFYTRAGSHRPAHANAAGAYTTPVTAHFVCTNGDAVLNQPCPAPVTITTSRPASTVATLTDTLGNVYTAALPAVTIKIPRGHPRWDR